MTEQERTALAYLTKQVMETSDEIVEIMTDPAISGLLNDAWLPLQDLVDNSNDIVKSAEYVIVHGTENVDTYLGILEETLEMTSDTLHWLREIAQVAYLNKEPEVPQINVFGVMGVA